MLTESNIRELVKMLDEEMDGAPREERERLETIEAELREIRLMLDRIWRMIEKTDLEVDDAAPRIREHMARKEQLELAAEKARNALDERRVLLNKAEVVAEFAADMAEFLRASDITESKAFLCTFIQRIAVEPGRAVIRYTSPMPEDSPIEHSDAAEVALAEGVRSSVRDGGPDWTKSRTDSRSWVAPSEGMGMVYRIDTSSPATLMPLTKLRISALRSGMVPACRNSRNSATYRLISGVEGRSARRCSSWRTASSLAAAS